MHRFILFLAFTILFITTAAAQSVIYVDDNASGINNGSSWNDAYTSLQVAIAVADSGTQIWVAKGTYKPTSGTDQEIFFRMKNGVSIFGGFTGIEVSVDDRENYGYGQVNETILSGDIGIQNDSSDNSFHIFYNLSGINSSAVLDGFTITGGNASGTNIGGGIYNASSSSPTIINCTFYKNSADNGGAVYNESSSPALIDCSFISNNAAASGGAVYNNSSPACVMTNCSFSGNWASVSGGGVYNYSSPVTMTGCSFTDNFVTRNYGGAVYNEISNPVLNNCTFTGNSAKKRGGGMFNRTSSPSITNCTFTNNTAIDLYGGAIYNDDNAAPVITNCTFSGNSAASLGGGIFNWTASPVINNCTFSHNTAVQNGGGIYNYSNCLPAITGSVFENNTAQYGGGIYNSSSSPAITGCSFTGNSASYGGGMYNENSSPDLTDCIFSGCSSAVSGGGIYNYSHSLPELNNCKFFGNSAVYSGGGIINENSSPAIYNSIFSGNTVTGNSLISFGGGLSNIEFSSPVLINCTFNANSAGRKGAGIYTDSISSVEVKNSIFWDDIITGDPGSASEIYNSPGAASHFIYSCIENGSGTFSDATNIFDNPLFADPDGDDNIFGTTDDDLRLSDSSICIGAGTSAGAPLTDILGIIRGGSPDMGAYENTLEIPLSFELISFTAIVSGSSIQVKWQTAIEIDNYRFEIFRRTTLMKGASESQAAGEWKAIGFVKGAGNSDSPKDYSFIDFNPSNGIIQYKLKHTDNNGNTKSYNKLAEVSYGLTDINDKNSQAHVPAEFTLDQNYPNPFNPTTKISFQIPESPLLRGVARPGEDQAVAGGGVLTSLKVYDMLGNEVATLVNEYKAPGYYEVEFSAGSLATGVYIYRITAGKFTAAKKLMLMK